MKTILFICAVVLCLLTVNAYAAPVLICKSTANVEGWVGHETNGPVYYRAYLLSDTELSKARVSGAYESDYGNLVADEDPNNEKKRHRFQTLEDAWCWFNLLAPKNMSSQEGYFSASIQYTCEEWHAFDYIDMSCFVKY